MLLTLIFLQVISYSSQESLQWSSWSRFSACSVTCGSGLQHARRECMVVDGPNTGFDQCIGPAEQIIPCIMLACPIENECNCGCTMRGNSYGRIRSSIPYKERVNCYWIIETKQNTRVRLTINNLQLAHGNIYLGDGDKFVKKVSNRIGARLEFPFSYTSKTNRLNVTLDNAFDGDVEFDAKYEEIKEAPSSERKHESSLNIPAIIGITACVMIIVVATCIGGYRTFTKKTNENIDETKEDDTDHSSISSHRHHKQQKLLPPSNPNEVSSQSIILHPDDKQKLLLYNGNGYTDMSNVMYIQPTNHLTQPYWGQGQLAAANESLRSGLVN